MREPMTEQRLREAQEVAWSPVYRPTPDFPEHVYRHDLFRDAVAEVERLRGTAGEWRSTLAALHHILAEHRIAMRIEPGRPGPPKLIADLMGWVATAVECETHGQRERAERAEVEAERLRAEMEQLQVRATESEQEVRERVAFELERIPIVQHLGITGCDSFLKRVAEQTLHYAATVAMKGGADDAVCELTEGAS